MRWVPLIIVAYLVVLIQTTVGGLLRIPVGGVGTVVPDLMGVLCVFAALHTRRRIDAMLAGWVLGFIVDLSLGGGADAVTPVGPMGIAYAFSAAAVFGLREAFFHERVPAQVLLTGIFCALAHGMWVSMQSLIALAWVGYGRMLLQAFLITVYSAAVAPVMNLGMIRIKRFLVGTTTER